tara:strand:- start:278 stop:436 length:159 start_codon:yes stop_codon:yes gene_type:complete
MTTKDLINNNVIDFLIEEIIGNSTYEDLTYWNKTSLCKLMKKKGKLPGRIIA